MRRNNHKGSPRQTQKKQDSARGATPNVSLLFRSANASDSLKPAIAQARRADSLSASPVTGAIAAETD